MSSFKPAGTESSSISVTNPYGYSCVSTSIVFGSFDIANPNKFRVDNLYFFVKIDISSDGGCRSRLPLTGAALEGRKEYQDRRLTSLWSPSVGRDLEKQMGISDMPDRPVL